jgi:N-acyl-D-aspartate/D-glutamate deacylase
MTFSTPHSGAEPELDLVIRDATVFDGSGLPPYRGDVGVNAGKIVTTGRSLPRGRAEIPAEGLAVSPGFIDSHTHFDAQICWDPQLRPVLEHGVTTVVTGCCSLSFAPLRTQQRDRLSRMFRRIEDVPASAIELGVQWSWETFDEYLRSLRLGLNVAPLVGHSLLRMWVMGEDAFTRAAADAEIAAIADLLEECIAAGAIGMSTSYVDVDDNLKPVPSRLATSEELQILCARLGAVRPWGVLQTVPEFWDLRTYLKRVDQFGELSLEHGIVVISTPLNQATPRSPTGPAVLHRARQWNERGARVHPQTHPRPVDLNFQLDHQRFLTAGPTWHEVVSLPSRAEMNRAYRDRQIRAKLIEEATTFGQPSDDGTDEMSGLRGSEWRFANAIVRGVGNPSLAGLVHRTLGDIAREHGTTATEAMIDIALQDDLDTEFVNRAVSGTGDIIGELLCHPDQLIGGSDGGAHVRNFATYGDTGYLFSKFVREAKVMTTAEAVRRLTLEQARALGLSTRGMIAPGFDADLAVFDPATIDRGDDVRVSDLPGGGARYVRPQVGMHAVIVNGQVAWTANEGYAEVTPGVVAR